MADLVDMFFYFVYDLLSDYYVDFEITLNKALIKTLTQLHSTIYCLTVLKIINYKSALKNLHKVTVKLT